jgi:adenylate cyclase
MKATGKSLNMASTRRLAAIFAADVAGYSRLMGADEEGTLERLKAHRRQLIDPKITEHRGRVVKTTGDGLLAEFPSVVDAVRCGVEVQRGMADREGSIEADQQIRFRVGINLGDVIVEGGDIFGDGVNVAARLEGLAEPGGICVSGTVRDHIGDRLPYAFQDLGEQRVKNIARPVRAYAMNALAIAATPLTAVRAPPGRLRHAASRPGVIATALIVVVAIAVIGSWLQQNASAPSAPLQAQASPQTAPVRLKPAKRLSLIVLPFNNLSGDPAQDNFTDAVTDDLTTDLSRVADSFVVARNTAFGYKGKAVDVKQLGRELGVRYVVEGSVRRSGEPLQVNAQVIDAGSGAHLWADRFDVDRADLAKAQNNIISRLARTIQLQLLEAAGHEIEHEDPAKLSASDLTLLGWAWYYRPISKEQAQNALRAFEQALEKNPDSPDPRVGIASVLVDLVTRGWAKSREDNHARAEQLLAEALDRNRNDPRAYYAMGMLRRQQNKVLEARISFEKAVALDRNLARGHLQLGYTLMALGQPEAALPQFEEGYRLNPEYQNINFYYSGLGACHLHLGHLDAAIDFLRKSRAATNVKLWYNAFWLAAALGLKGETDEAKEMLAEFLELKPEWHSLARIRAATAAFYRNPDFAELEKRTVEAGLLRAGLPEE